jgi:SlyX protein
LPATQRQEIHRLDFPAVRGQNLSMADETSRRIEKLESHVAHLEHQVEQLNGVVIEQGKWLERLKKEVQRQSSAMETIELEHIKANNLKPPHH